MTTPVPTPLLKLPLLLHLLTETPASLSFLFFPHSQLPSASPQALLILQNYGGLLLSTNLITLIFLLRPNFDSLSALVALSLGSYHIWPIYRACARLNLAQGKRKNEEKILGGPVVHFWVHVFCLVSLVGSGVFGLG
ncbi:hypothetical protein QC764_409245 [Podospora pseudoanserina]|uniref:Uncharacterized protein n=1 Tax=Podospora pseudoanserina TaxID=2609844 RepID=A0ABR0I9H9_9PEZI|nr:hypothetical protein QC764_409245 [Podospora pseudoanserina]